MKLRLTDCRTSWAEAEFRDILRKGIAPEPSGENCYSGTDGARNHQPDVQAHYEEDILRLSAPKTAPAAMGAQGPHKKRASMPLVTERFRQRLW